MSSESRRSPVLVGMRWEASGAAAGGRFEARLRRAAAAERFGCSVVSVLRGHLGGRAARWLGAAARWSPGGAAMGERLRLSEGVATAGSADGATLRADAIGVRPSPDPDVGALTVVAIPVAGAAVYRRGERGRGAAPAARRIALARRLRLGARFEGEAPRPAAPKTGARDVPEAIRVGRLRPLVDERRPAAAAAATAAAAAAHTGAAAAAAAAPRGRRRRRPRRGLWSWGRRCRASNGAGARASGPLDAAAGGALASNSEYCGLNFEAS